MYYYDYETEPNFPEAEKEECQKVIEKRKKNGGAVK